MKAQRESRNIALTFSLDTGWGWVIKATSWPLCYRKTDPALVNEAGWNSGPVWMGAENLAPAGIRSPDRPPRNEVVSTTLSRPNPVREVVREVCFCRRKLTCILIKFTVRTAQ